MAADFVIKQNDRLPLFEATLTDENGDPIDMTGIIGVDFRYRRQDSDVVTSNPAVVVDEALGQVRYDWAAADTATAGLMYAEWRVNYTADQFLTHPNSGALVIEVTPQLTALEEGETSLSIAELQERYLFGVDLTDDDGNPYPNILYQGYINSAIAWMEKQLDIPLVAIDIVEEVHDHLASDYGRWGYFQLDRYPVISISEVKFQYPSMIESVVIDPTWLVLADEGQTGVLQIVPGQGNIADVLLIPGHLMPLWSGAFGRVPGVWRISYRAGFEVGEMPADIQHAIAMHAAIGVLNIAGDLIVGAGIASVSIGVPGLNQSVNTTSSSTNSGYGARIVEYRKELKEMLPNLRRYYGKGSKMVVV